MVRYLTAALAGLAVVVPFGAAANWGLISSCPTPCPEPRGLVGNYLVGDGSTPFVYYLSLTNGSVFSSFAAPGGPGAWGITQPGENKFYLSNNLTSWIYKITSSGSVLSSFRCPLAGPADMGYPGSTRLEVPIPDMNVIAVINPQTGSLVATFAGPGLRPTSCGCYGWKYVADAGTHSVYINGKPIIEGINSPTGMWGIETTSDTGYKTELFIVDAATKHIFRYRDNVAVVPASLGRVKGLFR